MATLNIVELIEKNPIIKLSASYNNKLITKIKENFTEFEQQLFVSSFYCYLNCDQKNDFIIDLDNVWNWMGFSQKYNAERMLEKHFIIDKDYKKLAPPNGGAKNDDSLLLHSGKQDNTSLLLLQQKQNKGTGKGGHNKTKILINVKTFKSFCLKAGTKKADEIHEYYLKMEEMLHEIVQEESDELKLQLQNKQTELEDLDEKNNKETAEKIIKERALATQKILLQKYGTIGSIIYIIKVKTYENGQYIIKIGESRIGVQARFNEHKSNYEECLLLDCFLVNKSKDFEKFIHNHENIRENRVTDLTGHKNERELFLIGKKLSYKMITDIISNNINYFENHTEHEVEKLRQECDKLRQLTTLSESNIGSFIEKTVNADNEYKQMMLNKIENLEQLNRQILEKLNSAESKSSILTKFNEPLQTLGPRLQKINPDTLTIIKVYESVSECMKEDYRMKRPTITKAVNENTIYNGYRWLFVDRELESAIIHNIEPTKQTRIQKQGYIAKLNKDKTEILNVYLDRKTASQNNNYDNNSSLDYHVKNGTITNGNYYILYNECDENMRKVFEETHNNCLEPVLYKNGVGQYDANKNLVKEFICKYDCIKCLQISDKTLAKALDKHVMYNNTYFTYIGSKLSLIEQL
jgi:hypothetical protein